MRAVNKSEKIARFRRRLLKWFTFAARNLPWRRTSDPYRILVSEIMLQQTQVDRVIPKYEAFLKKFPSLSELAKASQSDVIKMWHGLGYNRRALSLHKLAKTIVGVDAPADPSKTLPEKYDELIALPGIGPYTAQAVRAFAFRKKDAAPVDTNIERVLKRVFNGYTLDKNEIQTLAHTVSPKDTWTWNHALMDFGASICVARAPKCEICPLKDICAAYPCDGGDIVKIKQSKFEDSDRMYRGRLISYLRANGILRRNGLLAKIGLADESRADRIIAGLIKEGFIKEKGGKITLV
jgi:A/G-specific adenine glycosylase